MDKMKSISNTDSYIQSCIDATINQKKFNVFRRNPNYTKILEHFSHNYGLEFLKIINKDKYILKYLENALKNDLVGSPITNDYPKIGKVSSTTLSYIKVVSDLGKLFNSLGSMSICEIGVGYGGLCRIIGCYYYPQSYTLMDMPEVLNLSRKYLNQYNIDYRLHYRTVSELNGNTYGLVISNYAFSELEKSIQQIYLTRIIKPSRRGYMIYNDISPKSYNSFTVEEIKKHLEDAGHEVSITLEEPLTHPKNKLIVWGENI